MSAATSLPFIIDDHNLNSKLDTKFSVMFTNYLVNFSAINTLKKKKKIVLNVGCIKVLIPLTGFVALHCENQG